MQHCIIVGSRKTTISTVLTARRAAAESRSAPAPRVTVSTAAAAVAVAVKKEGYKKGRERKGKRIKRKKRQHSARRPPPARGKKRGSRGSGKDRRASEHFPFRRDGIPTPLLQRPGRRTLGACLDERLVNRAVYPLLRYIPIEIPFIDFNFDLML